MVKSYMSILDEQLPEYDGPLDFEVFSDSQSIIILDDDPTGCQTVSNVPLFFSWEKELLTRAFQEKTPVFFILTNTRSMDEDRTASLLQNVLENIREAARITGRKFLIVSRSDSTLRGHYPLETSLIINYFKLEKPIQCLIPAFFQGGRYTINDIHYVKEGDQLVPAAETQFARDASFGFRSSDLREYVEEKTEGKISKEEVISFSIEELREKGPDFVYEVLKFTTKKVCIVNAISQKDLDVFAIGARKAINKGRNLVFRTAASFINSLANLPANKLIDLSDFMPERRSGILFIVGSYVKKSSDQLEHLMNDENLLKYELDVEALTEGKLDESIQKDLSSDIASAKDVVLYTTRKLIRGRSVTENLNVGSMVSDFITDCIRNLELPPRIIITKGGITSHVVAKEGMGITRARVLGQILPGVPVIKVLEGKFKDTVQIIFPGNVGEKDHLSRIYTELKSN